MLIMNIGYKLSMKSKGKKPQVVTCSKGANQHKNLAHQKSSKIFKICRTSISNRYSMLDLLYQGYLNYHCLVKNSDQTLVGQVRMKL